MVGIKEMRIYRALKISPLHTRRYMLDEDFTVNSLTIPNGFVTNGANIPRVLYPVLPPNDPIVLPAVVVHDYLCDVVKYAFNRGASYKDALNAFKQADDDFNDALESLSISNTRRRVYFWGVAIYTALFRRAELFFYRSRNKPLPIYKRNISLIKNRLDTTR